MRGGRDVRSLIRTSAVALVIWTCAIAVGQAQTVTIGGTGGALAAMRQLGRAFGLEHPGVRITVLPSMGSTGGIRALSDGVIDIAVSGRPLREGDDPDGQLAATPFARTAIAFLTSQRAEINLPIDLAAELLTDPAATWSDGSPVRIVARPLSESDYQLIAATYPVMQTAFRLAGERPDVPVAVTDQENLELAAMMEGSLTVGTILQVWSEGVGLYLLSVDGIAPTMDNVESGQYPLVKDYYLIVRRDADDVVEQFVDFPGTDTGRDILRRLGAVPVESQ